MLIYFAYFFTYCYCSHEIIYSINYFNKSIWIQRDDCSKIALREIISLSVCVCARARVCMCVCVCVCVCVPLYERRPPDEMRLQPIHLTDTGKRKIRSDNSDLCTTVYYRLPYISFHHWLHNPDTNHTRVLVSILLLSNIKSFILDVHKYLPDTLRLSGGLVLMMFCLRKWQC